MTARSKHDTMIRTTVSSMERDLVTKLKLKLDYARKIQLDCEKLKIDCEKLKLDWEKIKLDCEKLTLQTVKS